DLGAMAPREGGAGIDRPLVGPRGRGPGEREQAREGGERRRAEVERAREGDGVRDPPGIGARAEEEGVVAEVVVAGVEEREGGRGLPGAGPPDDEDRRAVGAYDRGGVEVKEPRAAEDEGQRDLEQDRRGSGVALEAGRDDLRRGGRAARGDEHPGGS